MNLFEFPKYPYFVNLFTYRNEMHYYFLGFTNFFPFINNTFIFILKGIILLFQIYITGVLICTFFSWHLIMHLFIYLFLSSSCIFIKYEQYIKGVFSSILLNVNGIKNGNRVIVMINKNKK